MTHIQELQKIIEKARSCYGHFHYWTSYYDEFPPVKCQEALSEKNKEKNHTLGYAFPFDHNLITSIPYYINASPMQLGSHKYIATQGPRFNTFSDFWHMVWAEKSELIVSVTNEREEKGIGHKYKFDAFWPKALSQEYGAFNVCLLEDKLYKKWSDGRRERIRLRKLEVKYEKNSRIVTHLHMENWMDGGIVYPESLIELSETADQCKGNGPITVHCAAGIGRTGTFIAFHSLYHDLMNILHHGATSSFDILRRVEEMREARYGPMIAEKMQFFLLVEALNKTLNKFEK